MEQYKYWEVNLELISENENGKIKKSKETHLVDANNVTEVENKVKEEMNGSISDYIIKSIKLSKIIVIY